MPYNPGESHSWLKLIPATKDPFSAPQTSTIVILPSPPPVFAGKRQWKGDWLRNFVCVIFQLNQRTPRVTRETAKRAASPFLCLFDERFLG